MYVLKKYRMDLALRSFHYLSLLILYLLKDLRIASPLKRHTYNRHLYMLRMLMIKRMSTYIIYIRP